MSVLNWQVKSSSNFASFFILMTHNSSVNFKLIHFLLWIKEPKNNPIFKTFESALVRICQFFMSFQKVQVSFRSNSASIFIAIKHNSYVLFLAQTFCTLIKSSSLKCKFLRFLSTRVKICHILHVILEITSQCSFKFCINLQCNQT